MKRVYRIIAAMLSAAVLSVAFLTGCGGKTEESGTATTPPATTAAATEKPAATPAQQTPGTPKPVVTPAPPEGYDASIEVPKAGIFDIEFENGAPVDRSENAIPVEAYGEPTVKLDEEIGREVASFRAEDESAYIINNFGTYYDQIKGGFSQEIYFKSTDVLAEYCGIASNMESGGFGFDFQPTKNGVTTYGFSIRIGGSYQWAYPEEDMEEDVYIHAIAVYDGTDLLLYVNGELTVETRGVGSNFTFPQDQTAQYFVIGGDSGAGPVENFFSGDIAFVRLYDEALNANQVYKLFTEAVKKAE